MKKFFNLLFVCLLGVMFVSCSEDEDVKPEKMIDKVIPVEMRKQIEQYMPIFDGENPPFIEGAYHMSPVQLVHSSDGQTPPAGLNDIDLGFFNQKKNRLDYKMETVNGTQTEAGKGMYIAGSGKYFTAYIASNGKTAGISFKSGVIISGIFDGNGISYLYWATVMIDKKDDPNDKLIKKGVFRVFKDKDEWSDYFDWER